MSKKNENRLWILIGLILLVAVIAAIVYFVVRSESVKAFRDDLISRVQELKRQIKEKESLIEWIKKEIQHLRMRKGVLVHKAKKFYIMFKCLGMVMVVGLVLIIHSIFQVNFIELVSTIVSMSAIIIATLFIVIKNEITTINNVLKLWQEGFIKLVFRLNDFEPGMIEFLEAKLIEEEKSLNQLKEEYNKMK